jgi:S-formylglutathione hydrolase FrmB
MLKMFKLAMVFTLALAAQDALPEPSQRTDAPYRLFRTKNTYTFLRLDTRTGLIWHVQWNPEESKRFGYSLNLLTLADNKTPGRFTLTPTENIYTFILSDQVDGRQWQVQWSTDAEKRLILPIDGLPTTADTTPAQPTAPVKPPATAKEGRPVKPVFGTDGQTWGQYQQALAQYETDYEAWLLKETRRQVQQEFTALQKQNAGKAPVKAPAPAPRKQP